MIGFDTTTEASSPDSPLDLRIHMELQVYNVVLEVGRKLRRCGHKMWPALGLVSMICPGLMGSLDGHDFQLLAA